MITFAPTTHRSSPTAQSRALAVAVNVAAYVMRWRKMRADRQLLQSLPDSLLSDIGISRGAIDHATRHGRDAF